MGLTTDASKEDLRVLFATTWEEASGGLVQGQLQLGFRAQCFHLLGN